MRKTMMAVMLAAAGLLANAGAMAAGDEMLFSESVRNTVQASVVKIDKVRRDLTLRMPDGELVDFKSVDPKISRFDQVKVNDLVNVSGSQSTAIALSKGTAGVRRKIDSEGRDVTALGAGVIKTRATYSDILAIDRAKQIAQVKNPDGKVLDIPVSNKETLDKAAVGDQLIVVVRATASVWGN